VRANTLLAIRGDSELHAGDEMLILADPDRRDELDATVTRAATPTTTAPHDSVTPKRPDAG
jgi:hypothetical protein